MLPQKLAAQGAVLGARSHLEFVLSDYEILIDNCPRPHAVVWPWQGASCGGSNGAIPALHVIEPSVCRPLIVADDTLGFSCSNYVFRKSLWHRVGGFSCAAGISADLDFLLRASDREIGWLDSVLFRKRSHDGNLWQPSPQNVLSRLRIVERWLRAEEQRMDCQTYHELRALSVVLTVESAWGLYWRRRWDEFEQLRRALSDYSDVPRVRELLAFTPYPRWLYPIRDFLGTLRRLFPQTRRHG